MKKMKQLMAILLWLLLFQSIQMARAQDDDDCASGEYDEDGECVEEECVSGEYDEDDVCIVDDGIYMPTDGLYIYNFWYLEHFCDFEEFFVSEEEWNAYCLYDAEYDY